MNEEELIWSLQHNISAFVDDVRELRNAIGEILSPEIPEPAPPKRVKGVFAKSPDPIVFGPDVLYSRLDMMVDYLYWENEDDYYIAPYDPSEWEHYHPYG